MAPFPLLQALRWSHTDHSQAMPREGIPGELEATSGGQVLVRHGHLCHQGDTPSPPDGCPGLSQDLQLPTTPGVDGKETTGKRSPTASIDRSLPANFCPVNHYEECPGRTWQRHDVTCTITTKPGCGEQDSADFTVAPAASPASTTLALMAQVKAAWRHSQRPGSDPSHQTSAPSMGRFPDDDSNLVWARSTRDGLTQGIVSRSFQLRWHEPTQTRRWPSRHGLL